MFLTRVCPSVSVHTWGGGVPRPCPGGGGGTPAPSHLAVGVPHLGYLPPRPRGVGPGQGVSERHTNL